MEQRLCKTCGEPVVEGRCVNVTCLHHSLTREAPLLDDERRARMKLLRAVRDRRNDNDY